MIRNKLTLTVATLAVAASTLGATGASEAAQAAKPQPQVLAGDLFSPFSVAVSDNGTRWFSQNFAGVLMRQAPGKAPAPVYQSTGGAEVGAVSVRGGKVVFALSRGNNEHAELRVLGTGGKARKIADIGKAEQKQNPDRKVTYGFRQLPESCAKKFPAGTKVRYKGIDETHPFASTSIGRTTYVADAGANNLWKVTNGKVRNVAVLPAVGLKVTKAFAKQAKFPACTVGRTHWFESVPTDVEAGPGGQLYVSTLPGGPEDGSLGAAGAVYKVNPRNGKVTKVAGGLVSATGLAVTKGGDVYVAELFKGRIAKIKKGSRKATTFAKAPMPSEVELAKGGLFATINVLTGLSGQPGDVPAGQLVKFKR
ncbi:ScyD/ScyE family protein [Nocardioides sp. SYSU D00038]|uniref:ScyD/ScyE family protein n=1 Tax=Nocardioides sp. SYSU D00038 TaxID=2812554 RepID=UPI0019677B64|nr:ScyD/ScyE family protein [Nocardioides sp. SYSU D00038]